MVRSDKKRAVLLQEFVEILERSEGDLIFFFFFGLANLLLGGWLVANTNYLKKKELHEVSDQSILKIIYSKGGMITAKDLAAQTIMTVNEAEVYLKRLEDEGTLERFEEEGKATIYRFLGSDKAV